MCSPTGGYPYLQQAALGREALSSVAHLSTGAVAHVNTLYTSTAGWSLLESMVVCAFVTTFGLFFGFRVGSRQASVPKAALSPILWWLVDAGKRWWDEHTTNSFGLGLGLGFGFGFDLVLKREGCPDRLWMPRPSPAFYFCWFLFYLFGGLCCIFGYIFCMKCPSFNRVLIRLLIDAIAQQTTLVRLKTVGSVFLRSSVVVDCASPSVRMVDGLVDDWVLRCKSKCLPLGMCCMREITPERKHVAKLQEAELGCRLTYNRHHLFCVIVYLICSRRACVSGTWCMRPMVNRYVGHTHMCLVYE